ncbi:class IV adenylate cyclase [bacterium]|nr:class IV adenylate cyclase [bacterium]
MDTFVDQTVEIKARCPSGHAELRRRLEAFAVACAGEFEQSDTFYNVPHGRLKLRRSPAGNLLIAYRRADQAGPKNCLVELHPCADPDSLDRALSAALEVRLVVRKKRTLFRQDNVRIHLDRVEGLGEFVEIEVLGVRGRDSVEALEAVCSVWLERLGIQRDCLIERAYADLLEEIQSA